MSHQNDPECRDFFNKIKAYLTVDDRIRVQKAFGLARREHGEQRRRSGELFFTHPLTVACYLSNYELDAPALCAALLHDIAEDTRVSIDELTNEFGPDVALLVDGVTKLKNVSEGVAKGRHLSPAELQDATLAKLFGVMTNDVRVVIIKLFDRLHNMRTIKAMPPHKQRQKAQETLSVFAPLANRLGIWGLKTELESLSLEVLNPEAFDIISNRREHLRKEHHELYQMISGQIMECLLTANIDVRKIYLSPESIYTIFQDLSHKESNLNTIDTTIRLVVIFNDWADCYQALGHIHQLWKPVPGTFDDYIANPLENLYRSLHTTVIHNDGQLVKIRLRTEAMDKLSRIGVLGQWLYKNGKSDQYWSQAVADRMDSLMENIHENITMSPTNPTAGVRGVVEDVFRRQIHVYTPRGDQIELPFGATPLDFAYAIHTGLGDQCGTAYVNNNIYPLNKPLSNGDRIKIVKKVRARPYRDWLDEDLGYLTTQYARNHALKWFRRLTEKEAIDQGRTLLLKELNMLGMSEYSHEAIAEFFGYSSRAELYYMIGRAELLTTVVATRILDNKWADGPARNLDNIVYAPNGESFTIAGADDRDLRLCGTCQPRPGDKITGFVRHDGGVTVHNVECHSLRSNRTVGRQIKLRWGQKETRRARLMLIQIDVYDRSGLLYEITQLFHEEDVNISTINTPHVPIMAKRNEMRLIIGLEVLRPRQLVRLLHQIQSLVNVSNVTYIQHSESSATNSSTSSPSYKPE